MVATHLRGARRALMLGACAALAWGCGKSDDTPSSGAEASGGSSGAAGADAGSQAGSGSGGAAEGGVPAAVCTAYAEGVESGTLEEPAITEASGLAASRKQPGVLWTHNDSGDSARLFALDGKGKSLGVFPLEGAGAVDWEDLALGPGPVAGTDYLYAADVGDNFSGRAGVQIYRVPEPTVDPQMPGPGQQLSGVERLELRYPDGAHDSEALLVDPTNGDLYLIHKTLGPNGIYRAVAPLAPGSEIELEKVGEVNYGPDFPAISPLTTAGDISPDRSFVVLRTYVAVLAWHWPEGVSLADALATAPCELPSRSEPQGEAIAVGVDGYFTVSEGAHEPVYAFGLAE